MNDTIKRISTTFLTHPLPDNLDFIKDRKAIYRWIGKHKRDRYSRLSRDTIYITIQHIARITQNNLQKYKRINIISCILAGILLLNCILFLYYY